MHQQKSQESANPLEGWHPKSEVPALSNEILTQNQIDWLVRNREQNGLAPYVRKFSERFYVKWPEFGRALIDGSRESTSH